MLCRQPFGISVVALATFAALASAQTTVKLKSNAGKSPLQAAIAELTVPSRLRAAQQKLWQAGEAAVPLLAAEVERGGAAESAALFVLERLGCEAESAVPLLRRLIADEPTTASRRAVLAATLAKIDGPPIVLVSSYTNNLVIELDLDGNETRRVACDGVWGAWPESDGNVGALAFSKGQVEVRKWDGQEITIRKLRESSGSVVSMHGTPSVGAVVFTSWQKNGELISIDADGKELWKHEIDAVRVERDCGDELLVVTRDNPRAIWYSLDGKERRTMALPGLCHNLEPLPGGGFLTVTSDDKVCELAPDGTKLSEFATDGTPNDVVRLRDGRTLVSSTKSVTLYAADGSQVWSNPLGYCGPMFVRMPKRAGH